MLGPDLLVAPVLEEGATDRQVYLPEHPGGWFDFHDGRHFDGATDDHGPGAPRPPACLRPVRRHDSGDPADRRDRSERRHAARVDCLRCFRRMSPRHTSTRMTEIRRTGRATAGWSFASSCGEAGRISSCLSIPSVPTGQLSTRSRFIRSPSKGRSGSKRRRDPSRSCQAHRRSKIESVPHRCSNSMKDVIHETSLAMVRPQ